jgi:cytidylate kinase
MQRQGNDVAFAHILGDIQARDARDTGRADAPLKLAQDALLLDTGDLTIADAVQAAIALVESQLRKS